ncbi:MAG: CBS domain-containing protein, partial [Campylobacterota bacterium]|nr:CBS domain-containing protein [Campylobacterota bacterium]
MKFPSIGDIASSNVISIDINKSVNDAIEKMIHSNHRDIVVIDAENYYILAALDIIHINKQNISMDTSLIDIELVKIPVVDKDTNILNIVEYLEEKTEYMCVKNRDGTLYGVVTHTDITSNIDPEILMDNYTVDDFLKLTRRIKWIDEDTVTDEALSDMAEDLLDSVVIVKDFKPIGILTTKDVVGLIKDRVDLKLSVKEYMTSPVDCVNKSIS